MYKILVVDDESIIRDGVGGALDSIGGFDVSFASNGIEVLEKCKTEEFDGMLIDIAMPKMDGIELLSMLEEAGDRSIKIILSAHDNFEYARDAMKYNVSEYLVKPLYPEDIEEIADKFKSLIENKKEKQQEHDSLIAQVEQNKDIIKNKLLQDLVYGNIEKDDYEIQKDFLGEIFESKKFRIVLASVKFDRRNIAISSREYQARLLKTANDIKKRISECPGAYYISRNSNVFCIMLCDKCLDFDIDGMFNDIKSNTYMSISGGVGETVDDIFFIRMSYREALIALKYNLSLRRESILKISDMNIGSISAKRLFDEEMFCSNLKLNERKQILELFNSISKIDFSEAENSNIYAVELMLQRMVTAAMGELLQSDFESYRKQYGQYYAVTGKLLNNIAISEKVATVKKFILVVLEELKDNADSNNSKIIDRAKVYINNNYDKDISINDIAMHVNLSKNYLGFLFKQDTGLNVIEYIHRIRIAHAKQMIETSNMKIYEVANLVGYTDQHYFSLIFKKIVGVSPSEYKAII